MNRILSLLLLIGAVCSWANARPLAVWDAGARATGGFGYRDNVLRSSIVSDGGGFFMTSADASAFRLSETGSLLGFFLMGEDTRYFNVPDVGYEQIVSGQAQYTMPVGEDDETGLKTTYLYQRQVLDVSETQALLRRVLVQGHGATVQPHWKHTWAEGWATQLEAVAMRQVYEGDLDDYWEGNGRLALMREYGHRSEVSVAGQTLLRSYDTREQFDVSGAVLPGTDLLYRQYQGDARWLHYWDAERKWRTLTRLDYMESRDNGSGYFDYDRLRVSQQVRWTGARWTVKATVRGGWYDYPVQQYGGQKLNRSYVLLDGRIERQIGKRWLLYAAAEHEWNMSNDPLGEYETWMASSGAGADF